MAPTKSPLLNPEITNRKQPQPTTERVNGPAAVAYYGAIKRDTNQIGRPDRYSAQAPAAQFEGAVQADFHFLVRARHLPRVLTPQPVVRPFLLPAIPDGLLENAVLVSKAVAHGRELHGGG